MFARINKVISVLLCMALIMLPFSACKSEDNGPKTVTIAVEADAENFFTLLIQKAEELYEDIDIELVTIPSPMDETREFAIQQMRTEIMAGKGPDAFLLPAGTDFPGSDVLFLNIEESMRSGIFLLLDDYIADAQFLNMENHLEVIMDAGKLDGEQLVLPLLYYYNVSPVAEDVLLDPDREIRYPQDIVDSGDPELIAAASRDYTWFESMFGDMVDYDTMQVTISEEEIAQNLETAAEIFSFYGDDYIVSSEDQAEYRHYAGLNERTLKFISDHPDGFRNVLMPNSDGGITATIYAFAAINRNAEHPKEAFNVIDFLFSYETLHQSALRPNPSMFTVSECIATGKNYYGEADLINTDFPEVTAEKITSVRFRSDFEELLLRVYVDLQSAVLNDEEYDVNEMAADIYRQMKMMVSE